MFHVKHCLTVTQNVINQYGYTCLLYTSTFDDDGAQGEGSFAELHNALINGTSWQEADHDFHIYDLPRYVEAKIRANKDYANRKEFGKKCLINIANAGKFSSDRAIVERCV